MDFRLLSTHLYIRLYAKRTMSQWVKGTVIGKHQLNNIADGAGRSTCAY